MKENENNEIIKIVKKKKDDIRGKKGVKEEMYRKR